MVLLQEQTSFIENSNQAILCLDNNFNVSFLTKGAELLFDLNRNTLHNIEDINLKGLQDLKTLIGSDSYKKCQVTTKDKITKNIILSINPKFVDGEFVGATLVALEAALVNKAADEQEELQKKDKKTFIEIRNAILLHLARKKMAINQISLETGINWKTVEKHLTFLLGKKMVNEVFSTEYLRIFEISENGNEELKRIYGEKIFNQDTIK